jgi:hypothetical protein
VEVISCTGGAWQMRGTKARGGHWPGHGQTMVAEARSMIIATIPTKRQQSSCPVASAAIAHDIGLAQPQSGQSPQIPHGVHAKRSPLTAVPELNQTHCSSTPSGVPRRRSCAATCLPAWQLVTSPRDHTQPALHDGAGRKQVRHHNDKQVLITPCLLLGSSLPCTSTPDTATPNKHGRT